MSALTKKIEKFSWKLKEYKPYSYPIASKKISTNQEDLYQPRGSLPTKKISNLFQEDLFRDNLSTLELGVSLNRFSKLCSVPGYVRFEKEGHYFVKLSWNLVIFLRQGTAYWEG